MDWVIIALLMTAIAGSIAVALFLIWRGITAARTQIEEHDIKTTAAADVITRNTEEARAIQDQIYRELEAIRGRRS